MVVLVVMKEKEHTMENHIKEWRRQYRTLSIMGIYMILYLAAFFYLEQRRVSYHVIHFGIDAYIPFCEYFVVPYILWFGYVAFTVVWLCLKDKEEGAKLSAFLMAGMTIFLIISALFPNGHHLRPKTFARDNIFVDMVKKIYAADTSTNVVPSIHVYNSIAVMIAVWRTKLLKNHTVIKWGMLFLGVSIICSTVLIKQHSMLDVLTAFILASLMYAICYRSEVSGSGSLSETRAKFKY